jgi:N-acetylmuramoyl-L-alanine amidase
MYNDDEGKKLASVVLQNLAEIYTTKQASQYRSQAGIWVLDQNTCPSILLQCGFINNTDDLAFITEKSNQEKVARKILESVVTLRSKNFAMATGTVADNPASDKVWIRKKE